jgi:hypothetical protein
MMQNRNRTLLLTLLLLSSATGALLFFSSGNEAVDKSIFKISNQATIDQVQFESKNQKVELKYSGAKWLVNNKYEADPQLIDVFFASVMQAEPKRKLSGVQKDSINNRLQTSGITVSFWQEEKQSNQFWVVGNNQKTETYFRLANDDPYFVTIPGYRVYVASIFELSENEWRNKRIFNFNWQNFKSLKAHFAQKPSQDFTVSLANGLFGIEEVAVADTTKLSGYLESIFNLQADRFLNEQEAIAYDSLLATTPYFQLEIQDIAKHAYRLEVYYTSEKEQRLLAKMSENQVLLLQPFAASRLLRAKDYFILK